MKKGAGRGHWIAAARNHSLRACLLPVPSLVYARSRRPCRGGHRPPVSRGGGAVSRASTARPYHLCSNGRGTNTESRPLLFSAGAGFILGLSVLSRATVHAEHAFGVQGFAAGGAGLLALLPHRRHGRGGGGARDGRGGQKKARYNAPSAWRITFKSSSRTVRMGNSSKYASSSKQTSRVPCSRRGSQIIPLIPLCTPYWAYRSFSTSNST